MGDLLLVGGVGSLVVAGFCYVAYRSRQNVVNYLQETKSWDVGPELLQEVKRSPNRTLDYVAVRGDATALQSTLPSRNVPAAKILLQSIILREHKVEWSNSLRIWHDTQHIISSYQNFVPFSLNSLKSNVKVVVEEPLSSSGLEYNVIFDKYEPLRSTTSRELVQWVSGEKTKGIQTVECALLEGTTLTAIGKVSFNNGSLKIQRPAELYEYFLSKLPLDSIILEKKSSYKTLKNFTIGFSIMGGLLLLYWMYKKWQSWQEPTTDFVEDTRHGTANDEQLCVICLARQRNVVILECGHICACRTCALQLVTCPVCRAEIVRLVPTYRS